MTHLNSKDDNILNKKIITSYELDDYMLENIGILCKGNRLYGLRMKQIKEDII